MASEPEKPQILSPVMAYQLGSEYLGLSNTNFEKASFNSEVGVHHGKAG